MRVKRRFVMKKKICMFIVLISVFSCFAKEYDFIVQYHTPSVFQLANGTKSLSNWWDEIDSTKGYHSDLEFRNIFASIGPVYFIDSISLGHTFASSEFCGFSFTGGIGVNYGHNNAENPLSGLSFIFYPVYDLPFFTNGKTSTVGYKMAFDLGYTFIWKTLSVNVYMRNIMFELNNTFCDTVDFGAALGFCVPIRI